MQQLRPYQTQVISEVRDALVTYRRVMVQLPTGGGKTVIFTSLIQEFVSKGMRVMVLVHRKELILQAASKLRHLGIDFSIIQADYTSDYRKSVQLASVQTLTRRKHPDMIDVLITDEAHHASADSYRKIYEYYPDAISLGFTATPVRADGTGLNDLFDYLVTGPQVQDLINDGYLSEPKVFASPFNISLEEVRITRGDYDVNELAQKIDTKVLIGSLVQEWKQRAFNKLTLVFALNVAHSMHIVDMYNQSGIRAQHIDGNTPAEIRDEIFRKFSNREITVLSNVGIATEGTDIPAIECVQLARPTKSQSLYLQMVGRALRIFEGKDHAIILDHAHCVFEHGFPQRRRLWTLDGKQKRNRDNSLMFLLGIDSRGAMIPVMKPQDIPVNLDVRLVELPFEESRIAFINILREEAQRKKLRSSYVYQNFLNAKGKPTIAELIHMQRALGFTNQWLQERFVEHHYSPNQEE